MFIQFTLQKYIFKTNGNHCLWMIYVMILINCLFYFTLQDSGYPRVWNRCTAHAQR